MFKFTVGHGNEKKQAQKLPFPCLIYGVLASQKDLKFDLEFLNKKKPLIIYRLMDKAKTKGEKSTSTDPNVTTFAAAPAHVTTGPDLAALT